MTKEEDIRQWYAYTLIVRYGYGKNRLKLEDSGDFGRIDIAVMDEKNPNKHYIVVEVKNIGIRSGKEQLRGYCKLTHASYGVWTNGTDIVCYDCENGFKQIPDIPKAGESLTDMHARHSYPPLATPDIPKTGESPDDSRIRRLQNDRNGVKTSQFGIDTLQIVYFPYNDEEKFKALLLDILKKKSIANVHVRRFYADDHWDEPIWQASVESFTSKAIVANNLRAGPLRGWQRKGIKKAEVWIDESDTSSKAGGSLTDISRPKRPQLGKRHQYTYNEDVLICYLYRFDEWHGVTRSAVLKYSKRTSDPPLTTGLDMRIANFRYVAEGDVRGALSGAAALTKRVWAEYKDTSEEDLRQICRQILGLLEESE